MSKNILKTNSKSNKFDKDYYSKLTDEQKSLYLYNIIVYGIYSEIEIKEEDL